MIPDLVLASASPRRREILDLLGLRYEVRVPEVPEVLRERERPDVAAARLAIEKVSAVPAAAGELILAADTLVALGDETLGKPWDRGDAMRMLERLQGERHEVYTGLALSAAGRLETGVAVTSVWFRALDEVERQEYVGTGEPLDKAGAYGIQGFGAAIVERIDGEYFNVMGLPVHLLLSLLSRFDLRYAFGRLEHT